MTERYGIVGPYILYAGSLGPHKNVKSLLEAYHLARLEGFTRGTIGGCRSRRWGRMCFNSSRRSSYTIM